ncbi:hypothetical protein [Actinocrispum sp. NPDC049592]|uniref:hypothetical protein n=1 Tax=Actinocrispum sp. NPDC049592 TaxID=3154835 RepID=UPI0034248543
MVLLGVAVLTAAGAFAAREFYRSRAEAQPSQPVILTTPTTTPGGSTPPSTSKPKPPGPRQVAATSDAGSHPQYAEISQMLQNYFDGINDKKYAVWRSAVTRARASDLPEEKWNSDYASTKDGNIVVYRITATQRGLSVLVTFTSTQKVTDAPQELPSDCIDWSIVLPVVKEDGSWRIDSGAESRSPRHEKCGTQTS